MLSTNQFESHSLKKFRADNIMSAGPRFRCSIPGSSPTTNYNTLRNESRVPAPSAPNYLKEPALWKKALDVFDSCTGSVKGSLDVAELAEEVRKEMNNRAGSEVFWIVPTHGVISFGAPFLFVKVCVSSNLGNLEIDFVKGVR